MNCVFARRRYVDKIPTVKELFSKMTIIAIAGRNSSSTAKFYLQNSYIPTNGVSYIFSTCKGYTGIWKFVNGTINTTAIKRTDTTSSMPDGALYHRTATNYNYWYYRRNAEITSGTSESGTNVYGGTILLVQFPYSADVVDNILANATYERASYKESSSSGNCSTTSKTSEVYLAFKADTFDAWENKGSASPYYSKIIGTSTAAASVSSSSLTLGSVYGGSIIGISSPTT